MLSNEPLPEIHVSNLEWSTPQPPTAESSPSRRISPDYSKSNGSSSPLSFQHLSHRQNRASLFSSSMDQNSLSLLTSQNNTKSTIHRSNSSSPVRMMKNRSPSRTCSNSTSLPEGRSKIDVDPYKILGLKRDDAFEEVKKSYRRLALLCHPRRNASQLGSARSSSSLDSRHPSHAAFSNTLYSSFGESFTGRDERSGEEEYNEETVREWHFIVVAASYETLSDKEHRKQYDSIWKRSQTSFSNQKGKHRRKKGFWKSLRKGLDINDSFDLNEKNAKEGHVECGCGKNSNDDASSIFNVCGTMESNKHILNVTSPSSFTTTQDNQAILTKLQSSRGGKKLMLDCKPLMLSDDENSQQQKSTGTVESIVTDEGDDDFVREETNHLFGGPLASMYKARQYQPFSDAFELFRFEFGSDIFRTRSCFDDEEEDDEEHEATSNNHNDFAQKWVTGGNGRLLDESKTVISSNFTVSSLGSKPALVHPVLPNIPIKILEQYGVLDGSIRNFNDDGSTSKKSKSNQNNVSTKVKREKKNGMSSEVTITTKIHGKMRIVRTQTTKMDENGKKKTVTSVKRETIPTEELMKEEEKIHKRESFIDLVPCCSFQIPQQTKKQSSKSIQDDVSFVSSTSSSSTLLSAKNFEDKKALKLRMKKLFLAQQRFESREE